MENKHCWNYCKYSKWCLHKSFILCLRWVITFRFLMGTYVNDTIFLTRCAAKLRNFSVTSNWRTKILFRQNHFNIKRQEFLLSFLFCVYKDINFTFLDFQRFSYIFSGNKSSNQYYLSKMRQLSEGRKTLGDGLEICGKKCNKYHITTSKTNSSYKLQWRITGK